MVSATPSAVATASPTPFAALSLTPFARFSCLAPVPAAQADVHEDEPEPRTRFRLEPFPIDIGKYAELLRVVVSRHEPVSGSLKNARSSGTPVRQAESARWTIETAAAGIARAPMSPATTIAPALVAIDRQARSARPEVLPIALPALVAILDAGPDRTLVATAEALDIPAGASGTAPSRRIEIVEALDLTMPDRDLPDESKAAQPGGDESSDDPRLAHGPTPTR